MNPKHCVDYEIDYSKYKQLAQENIIFWELAAKFGYETVKKMDIDEFLEAAEAFKIISEHSELEL